MFPQIGNNYIRKHCRTFLSYTETLIPAKRLRNCDYSYNLPDEILLHIFSFLSNKELYTVIRCVCKRWCMLASSPVLWKKITAQNEVPSRVLCKWIENSPMLREVNLKERSDFNDVTEKLVKHCKNLQSLKIENCKATVKPSLFKSRNLCKLLTKCKHLNNLHFSGIKIHSCKFFKLLSRRKPFGVAKKCSYYGPVNKRQMRALIGSIISSDCYDGATLLTSHRKISISEFLNTGNRNLANVPNVPDTVDIIWEDILNNNTEEDDDDYDAGAQMDLVQKLSEYNYLEILK
ncbi:hypothetical protein NQ315_004775 [Exocentrus adspersus]|uniref:F-box domain-containing protein n=1 Tax=Exocentrus adspersus TaxID=1586481 RepID=A0AAV8W3W8_9CUCU|nr:hypothetical protein NQ315_004775 [Exocentrus adspersus]